MQHCLSGRGCRRKTAAGQGKGGKKAIITTLAIEEPGALTVSKVTLIDRLNSGAK